MKISIKNKISFFGLVLGYSVWMAIFIPSLFNVDSFAFGQEGLELNKGLNLFDNETSKKVVNVEAIIGGLGSTDSKFKEKRYTNKSGAEGGGGFVKLGNGMESEGVSISDPPSNECSNNSKATGNEYKFIGTKIQFWLALLLGGSLGLIIGAAILKFIFYHLHPTAAG